jgi:hypothetical protein
MEEPLHVFGASEDRPTIGSEGLEDPVPIEKSPIEDGDLGVFTPDQLAVEIDFHEGTFYDSIKVY